MLVRRSGKFTLKSLGQCLVNVDRRWHNIGPTMCDGSVMPAENLRQFYYIRSYEYTVLQIVTDVHSPVCTRPIIQQYMSNYPESGRGDPQRLHTMTCHMYIHL